MLSWFNLLQVNGMLLNLRPSLKNIMKSHVVAWPLSSAIALPHGLREINTADAAYPSLRPQRPVQRQRGRHSTALLQVKSATMDAPENADSGFKNLSIVAVTFSALSALFGSFFDLVRRGFDQLYSQAVILSYLSLLYGRPTRRTQSPHVV